MFSSDLTPWCAYVDTRCGRFYADLFYVHGYSGSCVHQRHWVYWSTSFLCTVHVCFCLGLLVVAWLVLERFVAVPSNARPITHYSFSSGYKHTSNCYKYTHYVYIHTQGLWLIVLDSRVLIHAWFWTSSCHNKKILVAKLESHRRSLGSMPSQGRGSLEHSNQRSWMCV